MAAPPLFPASPILQFSVSLQQNRHDNISSSSGQEQSSPLILASRERQRPEEVSAGGRYSPVADAPGSPKSGGKLHLATSPLRKDHRFAQGGVKSGIGGEIDVLGPSRQVASQGPGAVGDDRQAGAGQRGVALVTDTPAVDVVGQQPDALSVAAADEIAKTAGQQDGFEIFRPQPGLLQKDQNALAESPPWPAVTRGNRAG